MKRCTLSGHILRTLQDLSYDHSQSDAINGYEALDCLNELVQSSQAPHEHESHETLIIMVILKMLISVSSGTRKLKIKAYLMVRDLR